MKGKGDVERYHNKENSKNVDNEERISILGLHKSFPKIEELRNFRMKYL